MIVFYNYLILLVLEIS